MQWQTPIRFYGTGATDARGGRDGGARFGDGRLTRIDVTIRTTAATDSSRVAERLIDNAADSFPSVGRCRRQLKAPSANTVATNTSFMISVLP